jgi:hypothetical protein
MPGRPPGTPRCTGATRNLTDEDCDGRFPCGSITVAVSNDDVSKKEIHACRDC